MICGLAITSLPVIFYLSVVLAAPFDDCHDLRDKNDRLSACNIAIQVATNKEDRALAFTARGKAFQDAGNLDGAISDYTKATVLVPDNAVPYLYRARAFTSLKAYKFAVADYSMAIHLDPNDTLALNERGLIYSDDLHEYDLAVYDFSDALRNDPKSYMAYFNRGSAYYSKGDYDRAIPDFGDSIKLKPDSPAAFLLRGMAHRNRGDLRQATADFSEAIWLDPQAYAAFGNRGLVNFVLGDYEQAQADFGKTGKLVHTTSLLIWRYLAERKLGQEATSELKQDAAHLPTNDWTNAVAQFYLGAQSVEQLNADASDAGQRCQATFHTGEQELLGHNEAVAGGLFQKAVSTCPHDMIEYWAAGAELKRVNR